MARHERRVGYGLPVLLAIGVHFLVLLVTAMRWPDSEPTPSSSSVVQATLVSTQTATDQAQRAEEARARAAAHQAEEAAAAEEARRQAEQEASEAARQQEAEARAAEQQAREQLRREAEMEAQRRAKEAKRQAQLREQQAEQRRREEQRRQAEEAERKRQEEQRRQAEEAERKRQEEQRRQAEEAERKRQEEQRRQAEEAERKRQEEARRRAAEAAQRASESSLDNLIAGEKERIANANQASEASNSFINLVRRVIEQAWILPASAGSQMRAVVRIQLLPTGELVSARIIDSSGDAAFDRSVLQAVERAAPFREMRSLPALAQRQFREFNLDFNPEDARR